MRFIIFVAVIGLHTNLFSQGEAATKSNNLSFTVLAWPAINIQYEYGFNTDISIGMQYSFIYGLDYRSKFYDGSLFQGFMRYYFTKKERKFEGLYVQPFFFTGPVVHEFGYGHCSTNGFLFDGRTSCKDVFFSFNLTGGGLFIGYRSIEGNKQSIALDISCGIRIAPIPNEIPRTYDLIQGGDPLPLNGSELFPYYDFNIYTHYNDWNKSYLGLPFRANFKIGYLF